MLATHAGGLAGAGIYYLAIQGHWGRELEDDIRDTEDTNDTIDDTMDIIDGNRDIEDDVKYTPHSPEYKIEKESLIIKER